VVRNPLASPDLVGVGASAGVAAVVTLILLPNAPAWLLPVGAWLGFAQSFFKPPMLRSRLKTASSQS